MYGCQECPGLPWAGDDPAVDFLGHVRGFPGDLVDRVGGQDVELDGVAERSVEDGALPGDRRGGCRSALQGQGQRVQSAADESGTVLSSALRSMSKASDGSSP